MRNVRCLRIGSRGSDLALWQSRRIQARLKELFPDWEFPVETFGTSEDRVQDRPLYKVLRKVEDKGSFTKQSEEALLDDQIDLAVHNLKDLPMESPPGLTLGAIPAREDAHDLWISRDGSALLDAPLGAVVGTSSLRRRAQLRALRPDLAYQDLRGNVLSRLERLRQGAFDALVQASAGLTNLGLIPEGAQPIPFEQMLPAPGQGALALQIRSTDREASTCLAPLDDTRTRLAVTAERSFLRRLQGDWLFPVGALSDLTGDRLRLRGLVADLSGDPIFRGQGQATLIFPSAGPWHGTETLARAEREAIDLGLRLADRLLEQGAGALLQEVREFLQDFPSNPGDADSSDAE